jgi:hypothetical protein
MEPLVKEHPELGQIRVPRLLDQRLSRSQTRSTRGLGLSSGPIYPACPNLAYPVQAVLDDSFRPIILFLKGSSPPFRHTDDVTFGL